MEKRLSLLVFGVVFFIYTLTLSPTINSFDSAEFVTGSYFLGIIHSPGYPLFLLLGHLAILLPLGQIPVRMNILSALFGASSALMSFNINYRLSQSYRWSVSAALFLAFSNLFWGASVITTVYTLSSLFLCLMFWQYLRVIKIPSFANLALLSLLFGLSLTHHISAILILPWLCVPILEKIREFRLGQIIVVVSCFTLPLCLYLYFPLRQASNPPIDYIRDYFSYINLSSFSGLVWMASGQMFRPEMFGRPFGDGLFQLAKILYSVWLNYLGLGLMLSLLGLWHAVKTIKVGIPLLGAEICFLLFYSYYNVVNNLQMTAPLLVLLSFTISLGGEILSNSLKERELLSNWQEVMWIGIIIVSLLLSNWVSVDRSKDWSAYSYASQVLMTVEPNALIVTQWTAATPLEYLHFVEQKRPDVLVFDRGLYSLGIRDLSIECAQHPNLQGCSDTSDRDLINYIHSSLATKPVYVTERDPYLETNFCFLSDGELVYRLLPLSACGN